MKCDDSGLVTKLCPTLAPRWENPARLLCPWDFPGKNTGVGCHFLLLGIFLTQGLKPRSLHWQADSLLLRYWGSPNIYIYMCVCVCVCVCVKYIKVWKKVKSLSRVWLFATPWTVAYQAPQSMEFSRQEYWSGLPFPSLGDFPNPGIEPRSLALQADALPSEPPGKPLKFM